MSVKIKGKYLGNLSVELKHEPSGSIIQTEPPVDNGGKGDKFSPTDLLVAALGSCMVSIIALTAKKSSISLDEMSISLEKHMSVEGPRRIAKIVIKVDLPKALLDHQRILLENAAKKCPVALSISEKIAVDHSFKYI